MCGTVADNGYKRGLLRIKRFHGKLEVGIQITNYQNHSRNIRQNILYIYNTIHHQQHNPKTSALCDEASIRLITNMQELHFPCLFFLDKNKCFWCIWITGPMLCKTWSGVLFRFEVSLSGRKIYFSDQKDSSKFWIILFCWNGGGHCNCNPPSRIMG